MSKIDEAHRRLWQHPSKRGEVADEIDQVVADVSPLASAAEHDLLAREVRARVDGLGPLQHLAADPEVTEIMVNAGSAVWVERRGRLRRTNVSMTPNEAEQLVRRLASTVGRRIDRSSPTVDARLMDGSRLHAVFPPLAIDGPSITIRRFRPAPVALAELAAAPVAEMLEQAVRGQATLVIAGPTGSGKTTLLNALADSIPRTERIVTIEDSAELSLRNEHVVRLESQPEGSDHAGVDLRELVRNGLRMRADRLICGEMRGPEAFDLIQALNTGHRGSLTTVHANGAPDAMRRIETLVLMGGPALPLPAIREQLVATIDLVVMMARSSGSSRSVVTVAEIPTSIASEWVLRTVAAEGRVVRAPTRPWVKR